ncbi:ABC transporter ATP-binding protein [Streptomyces sp. HPF1205]|uniref:ABC transporter ATP-binding protein n=1 Tax=Streptomyces sp. HPF1205 TaxID=2873262 RepID=UPI001CEDFD63|nr:ABC transporter ATP-binding protein [Streptomyces sp. HPF1205]
MSALEVRDLTVEYAAARGKPFRAVDSLSFSLDAGRTLALVGESGSGKSSVLRALSRLVRPAAGSILLDGREQVRAREYRRAVQMVFQDPFASLNPSHTVDHHLRRPLLATGRARRGEQADEAVAELLRQVNLTPAADVARKRPHELSGGQRQRVAIARALAPEPSVLLADEPVSMLDVSIRLEILNLLDRLKRDRRLALLYVTHDLATARHFSADIMVMYRGQVVERGPSDQVILDPRHPYTRLLAAAAPSTAATREQIREARRVRQAARARRDAERREIVVGDGCRFRPRCPFAMDVCAQRPPEVPVPAPSGGDGGHRALCWLYAEGAPAAPEAPATEAAGTAASRAGDGDRGGAPA